jgi:hypothetical protein
MVSFNKRILFVGFGAVARCTLPILLDHIKVSPKNITILDFEPNDQALNRWIDRGVPCLNTLVGLWDHCEHSKGTHPGLISHFTRHALLDVAATCLDDLPHEYVSASPSLISGNSSRRRATGRRSSTLPTPSTAPTSPQSTLPTPWQFKNFLLTDGD